MTASDSVRMATTSATRRRRRLALAGCLALATTAFVTASPVGPASDPASANGSSPADPACTEVGGVGAGGFDRCTVADGETVYFTVVGADGGRGGAGGDGGDGGRNLATFTSTVAAEPWTVPAGVTSIDVVLHGAQGGGSLHTSGGVPFDVGSGGLGASVSATLVVTPGEMLRIYVGGMGETATADGPGAGGFNGGGASGTSSAGATMQRFSGGGGGASDIRRGNATLTDRLIVAGGGGGATASNARGGDGGEIAENGASNSNARPGGGASVSAGAGGTGSKGPPPDLCLASPLTAGGSGTGGGLGVGGVGGDAGTGAYTVGSPNAKHGGGGGGGGYYGGGGGGGACDLDTAAGAGGGGSSYATTSATSVVHATGVRSGDGLVTIAWSDPGGPARAGGVGGAGGSGARGDAFTGQYTNDTGAEVLLCFGAGTHGVDGADGADGTDGADGMAGGNGGDGTGGDAGGSSSINFCSEDVWAIAGGGNGGAGGIGGLGGPAPGAGGSGDRDGEAGSDAVGHSFSYPDPLPDGWTRFESDGNPRVEFRSSRSGALPPPPASGVAQERVGGADRFETAAELSRRTFALAPVVYVVLAGADADAVVAAAAAGAAGAPVLFVNAETIPASTLVEIRRLNPSRIVIVGGSVRVAAALEVSLRASLPTVTVDRVAGAERVATAVAASKDRWPSSELVYVVGSEAPADAVVAAAHGRPVLFVHRDSLPAETLGEIRRLGASRVVIVGGTVRVGSTVEDALRASLGGVTVERVAGADRYETSLRLGLIRFTSGSGTVFIASGVVTADSHAAAAAAHARGAALILTRPTCLLPPTRDAIVGRNIVIVGGTAAIADAVADRIVCT